MSLEELEELLGVEEMFSEGCGGADVETAGILVGLQGEGKPEHVEKMDVDARGEETRDTDVDSDTAGPDAEAETNRQDAEAEKNPDVQPEEAGEVAQETSSDAVGSTSSSEEHGDVRRSGAVTSESPDSSVDQETADDQETDTNSTSTLLYILSTAISIVKAPLQPLVSTVTNLPGQVKQFTYLNLNAYSSNLVLHFH